MCSWPRGGEVDQCRKSVGFKLGYMHCRDGRAGHLGSTESSNCAKMFGHLMGKKKTRCLPHTYQSWEVGGRLKTLSVQSTKSNKATREKNGYS